MKRQNRRIFFFRSAIFASLFGLPGLLLARKRQKTIQDMAPFAHIVFFWLKEPENPEANEAFKKHVHGYLGQIDFIRGIHFGKAAGTPRDVVDNSYSYNMILYFDNEQDQNRYQEHPAHLKFVEDANHLWDRVQVYDSVGL